MIGSADSSFRVATALVPVPFCQRGEIVSGKSRKPTDFIPPPREVNVYRTRSFVVVKNRSGTLVDEGMACNVWAGAGAETGAGACAAVVTGCGVVICCLASL